MGCQVLLDLEGILEFSRIASNVSYEVLDQVMKKLNEALDAVGAANKTIAELEDKLSTLSQVV